MHILKKDCNFASVKQKQTLKLKEMKNESNVKVAKIDCKQVNAAGKVARMEIVNACKELDAERKSLSATIALIVKSDAPDADVIRAELGLQKNANKAARTAAEAAVMANIRYAIKYVYVTTTGDGDEVVITYKLLPSTSTGKERNDYLQVIKDAIATRAALLAKKREVARLARAAKNEGKTLVIDQLPKSLQDVFSTKYTTQIVAEKIIRN